jgi:hypothetical protein
MTADAAIHTSGNSDAGGRAGGMAGRGVAIEAVPTAVRWGRGERKIKALFVADRSLGIRAARRRPVRDL